MIAIYTFSIKKIWLGQYWPKFSDKLAKYELFFTSIFLSLTKHCIFQQIILFWPNGFYKPDFYCYYHSYCLRYHYNLGEKIQNSTLLFFKMRHYHI